MKAELLWFSNDPERLIALAMRRCYTTKVWELLQEDVSTPGYKEYLTRSAFRRLEFDVFEHVRLLFRVEATPTEMLHVIQRHPFVSSTELGKGQHLLSMNLRTLTEMGRRLHCDGSDCSELVRVLPDVSPTVSACIASPPGDEVFDGEKPSSSGRSDSDLRVVVVQHLPSTWISGRLGMDLPLDVLLRHSMMTAEVEGISRACSHQLVRHRMFSYSQESQRFSDAVNEGVVVPPSLKGTEARRTFEGHIEASRRAYSELRRMGIKKEDARFVLPLAVKTKVLLTGSLWQVCHASFYRSSFSDVGAKAQWEINRLFTTLYQDLKSADPALPEKIQEM